MRYFKSSIIILITVILSILLASCSGSSKNQSPLEPSDQVSDLPLSFGTDDTSGRNILAVYDAVIDPVAGTFCVTPIERTGNRHFPLTYYYLDVLTIVRYGFTPNFWADIKITHPLPGSGIDGFDPRVIAVLPARQGVRFYYPQQDLKGNNKVVLEPDGYTRLFDNVDYGIIGDVNPFKAYFKDQPNRRWSSTGTTTETMRWDMRLTGFGGSIVFKLVVDVSTNYPNPPIPVVDNAPEPVQIDASVGQGLTNEGGSANIKVTLLDWQGRMGVGGVLCEAPDLFNGTISLSYYGPGPYPNKYVYTGIITNSLLAPEGEYKILVATWDQATGIYIYGEFIATVVVAPPPPGGDLIWAKRAGGPDSEVGFAITTLSDNSTIVTGRFEGSTTFAPGEPNQTILTSAGNHDIFLARYNSDGTLSWAKSAGGTANDYSYGITTLLDNSTVATGVFSGSATFGRNEPNEKVLWSAGERDIFIARYNPDGTLSWAKRAGGSHWDEGSSITTLSDNSTVATGVFSGSATFGPGEPNQTILTSSGEYDIFIARYNPDGTIAWAKRAGGSSGDYSSGITTFSDNSTAVTGSLFERYNPDGTLAWSKDAGGWGSGITTLSDNSMVMTGSFSGSTIFGPGEPNQIILTSAGESDIFIARYNPDGTLLWAKRAGGSHSEAGLGITTLSDNSTVVTGYFGYEDMGPGGPAIFGPGEPNQTVLTSFGTADIFIARYNPNGTLSWAKGAGGSSFDYGRGITALSDDSTVVTGSFYGAATFGANEPNEKMLFTVGGYDIFIARFEP